MDQAASQSRRSFLAGAGALVTATLAGCGSSASAQSRAGSNPAESPAGSGATPDGSPAASGGTAAASDPVLAPHRVGYFDVLSDGRWTGPRDAGNTPDLSVVTALTATVAGSAVPMFLRMTAASTAGDQVPAAGSAELAAARSLIGAGVRLGVAIDISPADGDQKSADTVIAHARQVRAASESSGGIFDWIFLDKAYARTPAGGDGVDDLQEVIDAVTGAGWPRIMINATGFNPRDFSQLPQRTWGMARHFALLDGDYQAAVAKAVQTQSGAIESGDVQFVDYVNQNRGGSTAILKLEVPSQSQRFRKLSSTDQMTLLRLWAQSGPADGYRTIYPLFLPGVDPLGSQATMYDSLTAGTLQLQRSLMAQYG